MECELLNITAPIGKICPSTFNENKDLCYRGCGFIKGKLELCDKTVFVRLRKDAGFKETGNYGFCSINKNSMGAMQPCCETLCPLHLKVGGTEIREDLSYSQE